jgi:glycosyltransferase involved in cell wall biosynthesis
LTASNQIGGDGQPIDLEDLKRAARIETDSTSLARALVCVSQLDASVFEANTGKPTFLAAHSLKVDPGPRSFEERSGVLFFGALSNLKSPNVAGIDWLVDEVWPLISSELRNSNPLRIAGQVLPSLAKKWSKNGIEVLGLVPDLGSLANNQRIFIAPTRNAQGIPIKVLEAASYGIPSVITAILAQQLQWQNEREALIANSPSDFASAIERLLIDEHLWQKLRLNATQSVRKLCDPGAFDQSVLAAIDSVR